jgi:hypothetical protein
MEADELVEFQGLHEWSFFGFVVHVLYGVDGQCDRGHGPEVLVVLDEFPDLPDMPAGEHYRPSFLSSSRRAFCLSVSFFGISMMTSTYSSPP